MGLISLCLPGLVVSVYGNVVNSDADEFRLTAEVVLPNSADDDVDDDCDNDDDNEDGGVVKSALLSANNDENDVDGVAVNDDDDNNDGDDAVDDDVDVVDNVVAVGGVIADANVELRKLASRVTVLRVASSTTTSTTPSSSTNPFPLLAASSATVTPTMLYTCTVSSQTNSPSLESFDVALAISISPPPQVAAIFTQQTMLLWLCCCVTSTTPALQPCSSCWSLALMLLPRRDDQPMTMTSLVVIYIYNQRVLCRTQVWLYNTA